MINEIFPHRFNNQYLPNQKIAETDLMLHFKGNSILLKSVGDDLKIPQKKDLPEISAKTEHIFLFSLNDVSCFLIPFEIKEENPGFTYKEINYFRFMKPSEQAWITIIGFHLMNWYARNKFCGKCGAKTLQKSDERALICPDCKTIVYPKISPAVIVAIICKDKILLARNSIFPGKMYSLVAGYVDVGESLEETLMREVKEEVGLDIKNIRYYKSQPWPLSGSMMIGFIADADENQPITIDDKEIADAAWFTKGNLPEHSSNISIAGEMIEKFEKGEL